MALQASLQLGPAFTFLLGATVLALGLAVLRAVQSPAPAGTLPQPKPSPPVPPEQGALLLVIAVAVGGLAQVLLELLTAIALATLPPAWAGLVLGGSGLAGSLLLEHRPPAATAAAPDNASSSG
jgi:hypothetical protein